MKASGPAALFRQRIVIFIEKEAVWTLWIRGNFLPAVGIQTTKRSARSLVAVLTSLSGLHVCWFERNYNFEFWRKNPEYQKLFLDY